MAVSGRSCYNPRVKLVKAQINGDDRVVLKENATLDDLRSEAARLRTLYGYEVRPDGGVERYLATHRRFRGRYHLALEPE